MTVGNGCHYQNPSTAPLNSEELPLVAATPPQHSKLNLLLARAFLNPKPLDSVPKNSTE